jgi:UDP-2,3-diacylglucosamine pyrophosphatase LpxH
LRVAILSDTHFGDDLCTLVVESASGPAQLGPAYPALARAVGRADYLVLLGDVLDFSVASYEKAYRQAKVFFSALQADGLARQLVYIPGNHDFDIWNIVEHQVNVINQLKQGELPRAFKRSVPGVIDDRSRDGAERLVLPRVTPKPEWHDNGAKYGNLFLDHITRVRSTRRGVRAEGRRLTFNFVYPNLYLVSEAGDSVLVTHGHYFEAYWSLASDWLVRVASNALATETRGRLNLQELVGINLPLNQLACTGIGQAEPLTSLVRTMQRDVYAGRLGEVSQLLDRLESHILAGRAGASRMRRFFERHAIRWLKRATLRALVTYPQARYSREFLTQPSVRERFRQYFRCSLNELEQLSRDHGINVPVPSHVVFGHTHQPIPWGSDELVDEIDGHTVRFCNAGGWLRRDNAEGEFVGAEVIVYESGVGFRSHSIRGNDLVQPMPVEARDPRSGSSEIAAASVLESADLGRGEAGAV